MNIPLTDELVLRFRAGDKAAFESLFNALHPALLYLAESYVSEQVAEEVTVDAFLKLWNKHQAFSSLPALRKFLYVVTRRDCISELRKERTRHNAIEQVPLQDIDYTDVHFFEEAEFIALSRIHAAIQQLPPQQQSVVRLSFFEKQKNDEIAHQLGLSVKTVKNHKTKALDNLRGLLTPEDLSLLYMVLSCAYFS